MTELINTIVKYDRRTLDNYSVVDYTSKNIKNIQEYIDSLDDDLFDWYQMEDNDKLERIALELYGNADYWDILLIINERNPLFQLALDFDTLAKIATSKVLKYEEVVYKASIGAQANKEMDEKYNFEYVTDNEDYRVLRIVKPSRVFEFLQGGYEQGYF